MEPVQPARVVAHDDDRVVVELEDEELARRGRLCPHAGEQPAGPPDRGELVLVDRGVDVERTREGVPVHLIGERPHERHRRLTSHGCRGRAQRADAPSAVAASTTRSSMSR